MCVNIRACAGPVPKFLSVPCVEFADSQIIRQSTYGCEMSGLFVRFANVKPHYSKGDICDEADVPRSSGLVAAPTVELR